MTTMTTLDRPVEIKAGPDDGLAEGEFTAYAAVFDNVDSYGDVMVKGAFDATLAEWRESGDPIPLYWGHNIADPDFNIGEIVEAAEDDRGLLVRARLDLDNPKSAQTYRLLKGRRVREMSFGFSTVKATDAERGGRFVREVSEVKLYEVSVVPVGANPDTSVLAVRSAAAAIAAGVKAHDGMATKNEGTLRDVIADLREAADDLEAILPAPSDDEGADDADGTDAGGDNDQEKASGAGSVEGKSSASPIPCVENWAAEYEFNIAERSLA